MADIFISYAGEDKDTAAHLAGCLQQHGWSVWWRNRKGTSGLEYAGANKKALSEAHAVLVLWSKHSAASVPVQDEASEGARRRVLIPILLEHDLRQPAVFRQFQAMDLMGWAGDTSDPNYVALERAISRFARPSLSELALAGVAVESRLAIPVPMPSDPGRPMRIYGFALAVGTAAAVTAVSFVPAPSPGDKSQSTSVELGISPQVVRIWPDSVQASSMTEHHAAQAAFDGETETAWMSKVTSGGSSEWIQASFSKPTYIQHAVVLTGDQGISADGAEPFYGHARPRQLQVSTKCLEPGAWGTVAIGQHERRVEIDIASAVPYIRFDAVELWSPVSSSIGTYGDVSIAEIELYGYPLP